MSKIATIEVLENIRVKQGDIIDTWEAGSLVVMPLETAQLIVAHVGHKVRLIKNRAVHPLVGCPVSFGDQSKAWIVTATSDDETDRSLLLVDFAEEACFKREADVHPYHCPACNGESFWWDLAGVRCARCFPPVPRWDRGWAELEFLTKDQTTNPNRTLLQAELDAASTAFAAGNYPNFQKAVIRARWGMPP